MQCMWCERVSGSGAGIPAVSSRVGHAPVFRGRDGAVEVEPARVSASVHVQTTVSRHRRSSSGVFRLHVLSVSPTGSVRAHQ